MKTTRVAVLVVAVVALGAGCSEGHSEAPTSSKSTEASPASLTREQGAAKYLEMVKPYNKEMDRCLPVLNPVLDSKEATSRDVNRVREACTNMPAVNRQFADDLPKVSWPAEVRAPVSQLVDELHADQLAWQEISEARFPDDLLHPEYPLPGDGKAASLVRAHLGLPDVEDVKE